MIKISSAIKNMYGSAFKINFVDKVSGEELLRLQEAREREMPCPEEN